MKKNLNILILISLFAMITLPTCYLKFSGIMLRFSLILSLVSIFLFFILRPKIMITNIQYCLKSSISKYILYLFVYILCLNIVMLFLGKMTIAKFIHSIILRFIPLIIIPFFLGYISNLYFDNKHIIRFYYYTIFFILILGIVDFCIFSSSNNILQNFYTNTIINSSILVAEHQKAYVFGIPRVQSVFAEPSYFALYLCIHLPLIYEISSYKNKLFKNKVIEYCRGKILPILSWIMLIATMSPIYLIAGIIISIFYILSKKINNLKSFLLAIIIFFFFISSCLLLLNNIDLNSTFLGRIQNTIKSISDFDIFIYAEPSLATRIICYVNTFIVFLKHPILGVGFGNILVYLYHQFLYSPLPLTGELRGLLLRPDATGLNYSIFWLSLAEIGIIGTTILYIIFYKIIKKINKLLYKTDIYEYIFVYGMFWALLITVTLSIYDSRITDTGMWSLLGILAGFQIHKKNNNNTYKFIKRSIYAKK